MGSRLTNNDPKKHNLSALIISRYFTMLESTRVRSRILTPYFILPLGKADHTITVEKPMIGKNNAVVLGPDKQPLMETVTQTISSNWGVLFLKRSQNVAYFIHSLDELKLVAITKETPFLNIANEQANEELETVPFSIIDALSTFLTEQDSVINNVNLSTLVKSGFISYDFQVDNVKKLLSDYCQLNSIVEIDNSTIDTIIARDNAQKMGIVHTNFALHDQLKPLMAASATRNDLSTDNSAVTFEIMTPTAKKPDYIGTVTHSVSDTSLVEKQESDLKSFDQGVNGKAKTAK